MLAIPEAAEDVQIAMNATFNYLVIKDFAVLTVLFLWFPTNQGQRVHL